MLANNFAQASPDAIAQDCAADLARRHKSGAKTVIRVAGDTQHQQFAALSAAVFPDELKFRTSR
jgi:arginyl-tRNA synthetase